MAVRLKYYLHYLISKYFSQFHDIERVFYILMNGLFALLIQILLNRYSDKLILSNFLFVIFLTNFSSVFPSLISSLLINEENNSKYLSVLRHITIVSLITSSLGGIYFYFNDTGFNVFFIIIYFLISSLVVVVKRGFFLLGDYVLDLKYYLINLALKLTVLIFTIVLYSHSYLFFYLFILVDAVYLFMLLLPVLRKFHFTINMDFSITQFYYSSRFALLNYILYAFMSGFDKFFLKSVPLDFVFVSVSITYIGYANVFCQNMLDAKSSTYIKLNDKSYSSFIRLVYKPMISIGFVTFISILLTAPIYFFIGNISVTYIEIIGFLFLLFAGFFNTLTKTLNVFIYQKGNYFIQLNSTLIAFPILLLISLKGLISMILVSTLIALFSSMIYYFYTKYKINEYNLLYNDI